MKIEYLQDRVYASLKRRGHSDDDISGMTQAEAFIEYCEWNALLGWGGHLLDVMENLERAK